MSPTAPATPTTTTPPAPGTGSALSQWLATERNRYFALGGGILLVGLVAGLIVWGGKRKQEFAMRALDEARSTAEAGNLPLAASQLQRVIANYSGTDAAAEATLSLNQVRLVNGQAELAVNGLKDFIKTNPPPRYLATSQSMLGTALENTKKAADAAEAFMAASASADLPMLKAEYLLEAGRAYTDAGKKDGAIKAYRTITTQYKDQPANTEAMVRLSELTNGSM